ncbi:MAG: hypothetical protein ACRDK9_11155 [Solirubrobacterales bacterium]
MTPTTESRVTRLLPLACLAGAAVLFASQLMTIFEFTPPGAEPLADRSVIDHHGPALAVIAVFAVFATLITVWGASKPAAVAVGVMGGLGLLIFLLIDLPDAGQVGTLDDARQSFFDAEAVPQEGFWLEMLGALALAVSGVALATLSPEQLASLRPRGGARAAEDAASRGAPAPESPASVNAQPRDAAREVAAEPTHRGARRHPQSRQRG